MCGPPSFAAPATLPRAAPPSESARSSVPQVILSQHHQGDKVQKPSSSNSGSAAKNSATCRFQFPLVKVGSDCTFMLPWWESNHRDGRSPGGQGARPLSRDLLCIKFSPNHLCGKSRSWPDQDYCSLGPSPGAVCPGRWMDYPSVCNRQKGHCQSETKAGPIIPQTTVLQL